MFSSRCILVPRRHHSPVLTSPNNNHSNYAIMHVWLTLVELSTFEWFLVILITLVTVSAEYFYVHKVVCKL